MANSEWFSDGETGGQEISQGTSTMFEMAESFLCLFVFLLFNIWYTIYSICRLVTKLCSTLCSPMDCSPSGSSLHGISQARILEWVAISYSRGFSQPVSLASPARASGFLTTKEVSPRRPPLLKEEYLIQGLYFYKKQVSLPQLDGKGKH